ncbi:MAG: helix-turn-helix domain-containing protein [Flavonifractor plautii]
MRVEQSKPLLLNPALTVGDVGYLVGFCEQSYFVKVFRRYTGMTPRQYQQSEKRGLSP